MSKILKTLTVSLLLASIMIATVAGGVFAADGDGVGSKQYRNCACEFVDCDGDGPWGWEG